MPSATREIELLQLVPAQPGQDGLRHPFVLAFAVGLVYGLLGALPQYLLRSDATPALASVFVLGLPLLLLGGTATILWRSTWRSPPALLAAGAWTMVAFFVSAGLPLTGAMGLVFFFVWIPLFGAGVGLLVWLTRCVIGLRRRRLSLESDDE